MKKFYLLITGFIAMFGFMFATKAAENMATLECTPSSEIQLGGSTNCTVKITSADPLSKVVVVVSTSRYLEIKAPEAGPGWTLSSTDSSTTGNKVYKTYTLTASTPLNATTGNEVYSFTGTLSEDASVLSADDECAQICLQSVVINDTGNITQGLGTCFDPVVKQTECTENCDPKNPETGAFMNYLLIAGIGAAAIAVILIVRRTTKFYRV